MVMSGGIWLVKALDRLQHPVGVFRVCMFFFLWYVREGRLAGEALRLITCEGPGSLCSEIRDMDYTSIA